MWLLNARAKKLEYFNNERDVPGGYAILSHRWGSEDEEVAFSEVERGDLERKRPTGYRKIIRACGWALENGLKYVWIDTCCIDKKSSAELSEAINSMFRYYQNAARCYVYLDDVLLPRNLSRSKENKSSATQSRDFANSLWFTRGWTLQELIAPTVVEFRDEVGNYLGSKKDLAQQISDITHIDVDVLEDCEKLSWKSVAARMSWAASRITSREEDIAYSLLGIFDVNMPLLYGEGGKKAFRRLQEEIIRQSNQIDHSILAWVPWDEDLYRADLMNSGVARYKTLLSPSPYGFRDCGDIISWAFPQSDTFEFVQSGLRMTAYADMQRCLKARKHVAPDVYVFQAALNCCRAKEPGLHIALTLIVRPNIEPLGGTHEPERARIYDRMINQPSLPFIARQYLGKDDGLSSNRFVTFTLSKEPFSWRHYRPKIHISFRGAAIIHKVSLSGRGTWDQVNSILDLSRPADASRSTITSTLLTHTTKERGTWSSPLDFELPFPLKSDAEPTLTVNGKQLFDSDYAQVSLKGDKVNVETRLVSIGREIIWSIVCHR